MVTYKRSKSVNEPEKCVNVELCGTGVHGLPAGIWQNSFLKDGLHSIYVLAIEKNDPYNLLTTAFPFEL